MYELKLSDNDAQALERAIRFYFYYYHLTGQGLLSSDTISDLKNVNLKLENIF